MKSPVEIKNILESLVKKGLVSIESKKLENTRIIRLSLIPENDIEQDWSKAASIVKPEYIYESSSETEPEINLILKRLLLEGVSIGALHYMPQVDKEVAEFLIEADKTSSSIIGRDAAFENMIDKDSIIIELYRVDTSKIEYDFDVLASHTMRPDEKSVRKVVDLDGFYLSGFVAVNKDAKEPLEQAFKYTQNIEKSWTEGDRAIGVSRGQGSSSVGDVFVTGGQAYCICGHGFSRINDFPPAGIKAPEKNMEENSNSPSI